MPSTSISRLLHKENNNPFVRNNIGDTWKIWCRCYSPEVKSTYFIMGKLSKRPLDVSILRLGNIKSEHVFCFCLDRITVGELFRLTSSVYLPKINGLVLPPWRLIYFRFCKTFYFAVKFCLVIYLALR